MNKIKACLDTYGTECTLISEDNETYALALGDEVERSIQNTMSKNDRVSLTLAAIIIALSFCDDTKKAAATAGNPRSQIKDYLEDSPRSHLEANEARCEIERMKQEIRTLCACLSAGGAAQSPAHEPVRSVLAASVQEEPVPSPEPRSLEEPEGPESPSEEEQPEENRLAVPTVPNMYTGHYSRPASAQVPEELDRSSFMSFFEEKETDWMPNIPVRRKKGTLR